MGTKIGWADESWNPVTGCSKVSAGCENCYAERVSLDRGWSKKPWAAANAAENVILHPDRLDIPRRWREPRRIFACSMADLFHKLVPDAFLAAVFAVMVACSRHRFMILTKRPERAANWPGPWAPNIGMGTSVEDARVLHRIETLRRCPAARRFVSFEPLIGPVGPVDLTGIHMAIVGGESGPGFRPMHDDWARELRDQYLARAWPSSSSSTPRTGRRRTRSSTGCAGSRNPPTCSRPTRRRRGNWRARWADRATGGRRDPQTLPPPPKAALRPLRSRLRPRPPRLATTSWLFRALGESKVGSAVAVPGAGRSGRPEHPLAQQVDLRPPVALALDQLQPGDLAFRLAVAPPQRQPGLHGGLVRPQRACESLQLVDAARLGLVQPRRQPGRWPTSGRGPASTSTPSRRGTSRPSWRPPSATTCGADRRCWPGSRPAAGAIRPTSRVRSSSFARTPPPAVHGVVLPIDGGWLAWRRSRSEAEPSPWSGRRLGRAGGAARWPSLPRRAIAFQLGQIWSLATPLRRLWRVPPVSGPGRRPSAAVRAGNRGTRHPLEAVRRTVSSPRAGLNLSKSKCDCPALPRPGA